MSPLGVGQITRPTRHATACRWLRGRYTFPKIVVSNCAFEVLELKVDMTLVDIHIARA
jgi:hypothetical protein